MNDPTYHRAPAFVPERPMARVSHPMTQDTEDVVARVAEALWTEVQNQSDGGWPIDTRGHDDLTGLVDEHLDFKELARAALEASERQSLSDRIDVLTQALKPFADCVDQIADDEDDEEWAKFRLLIKDYRRARAALHQEGIAPGAIEPAAPIA